MKNVFLIVILFFQLSVSLSQNIDYSRKSSDVSFSNQLSDKIYVTMKYRDYSWGMGQQFYKITLKNLTSNNLRIEVEYFANLTCGNKSTTRAIVTLKPYETLNDGNISYVSDVTGLVGSADESECKGVSVTDPNGVKRTNRISTLGYRFIKIENIDQTNHKNEVDLEENNQSSITEENTIKIERENAQKAEINRQNEEQIRIEKQKLDNQNRQIVSNLNNVTNSIYDIKDNALQNLYKKAIDRENQYRQSEFTDLKDKLENGHGVIEDCHYCDGNGSEECSDCNGNGNKTCLYCSGIGSKNCLSCFGLGKSYGKSCIICGGTGKEKCINCNGSGKEYCNDCHATGDKFCNSCQGTGKKFKSQY